MRVLCIFILLGVYLWDATETENKWRKQELIFTRKQSKAKKSCPSKIAWGTGFAMTFAKGRIWKMAQGCNFNCFHFLTHFLLLVFSGFILRILCTCRSSALAPGLSQSGGHSGLDL